MDCRLDVIWFICERAAVQKSCTMAQYVSEHMENTFIVVFCYSNLFIVVFCFVRFLVQLLVQFLVCDMLTSRVSCHGTVTVNNALDCQNNGLYCTIG